MKILMIAPEPYFEPRGTPFSEYFRIKALTELGHQVELVTYPIGADRLVPGLTIVRAPRLFGWRTVRTGPSLRKVFLDAALFARVLTRIVGRRYDLVHTHEEGSVIGGLVARLKRIPHLYDMHSSLVQQMDNFQFSRSRLLKGLLRRMEIRALRGARSVIVICRSLFDYAASLTAPGKLTLIENFLDEEPVPADAAAVAALRRSLAGAGERIVLYTGTFEAYQGIPLLIDSLARLGPEFRLVMVGGDPVQVEAARRLAVERRLSERIVLPGRRPPEEIPLYRAAADVLVSPRTRGTNIPLKVYACLKSGVPLVATDLPTHTQTLTPEIAVLAAATPEAFAEGIRRAAGPEGPGIAARAAAFCRAHYSPERYRSLVAEALAKAVAPKS